MCFFKPRRKIYLPDYSSIYTNLISKPERNVCKKIATRYGNLSNGLPCWFVWESPEIQGTLMEKMFQYSTTADNSLLLIDGQQKHSPLLPPLEQITALCESPKILAFSPSQDDGKALMTLLVQLTRSAVSDPSKTVFHIVFNQVENLPLIADIDLLTASTLRHNINYYFVCNSRKMLESRWNKELLFLTRCACACELIRESSKKAVPSVQYFNHSGDSLGADWETSSNFHENGEC